MKFEEYRRYDGMGLAALVAKKEVSAIELLEAAIARAEAVNPQLNAIIIPMYDIAREQARKTLSGPFAGVPFLTKDLFQEYAGVLYTKGNKALKKANHKATHHATLVERWLKAGCVILGRCNTPEFGAKGITEPLAWGPTKNPWNLQHSTGGSSGGSAAAIAAGIVPMAGANDGGGSIRIPASNCGLFGLKPGRGRVPCGPDSIEMMHGAVVNHILSRSVRDSAAMLDATEGPEVGSYFHLQPPARAYLQEIEHDPKPLKIAFSTRSPIGGAVGAEAIAAVEKTATLLESLGHHVEQGEPDIDGMQMARDFTMMWFSHCAVMVDDIKRITGCGNNGFEPDSIVMAEFGRFYSAQKYVECYLRWNDYTRALGEFHQHYDLWLSPTQASPPIKIGECKTPLWKQLSSQALIASGLSKALFSLDLIEEMVMDNLTWIPYTQLANMTGTPAMSVPLHWCDNGLPLGVQFVAAHGGESRLIQLAAQLERATPWFNNVPQIVG